MSEVLLPVTHRSRNTWNGGGWGGGCIHKFCSRMIQVLLKNGLLTNVYSSEAPKFVVTINWLQLNAFTEGNPEVTNKCFLLYRNSKAVNLSTTLTSS